jgi:hypothetical protein
MRNIELVRLITGLKRKIIMADVGINWKNLIITLQEEKYMSMQIEKLTLLGGA